MLKKGYAIVHFVFWNEACRFYIIKTVSEFIKKITFLTVVIFLRNSFVLYLFERILFMLKLRINWPLYKMKQP
jgi:hypothetical protein